MLFLTVTRLNLKVSLNHFCISFKSLGMIILNFVMSIITFLSTVTQLKRYNSLSTHVTIYHPVLHNLCSYHSVMNETKTQ